MKPKAFTLIEILLCLTLILAISIIVIMFTRNNSVVETLHNKVTDYVTLTKFAKANAEINGQTTQIIVETNKLKAIEITLNGETNNISTLQFQLETLNDSAIFSGETLTFYPDGSLQDDATVSIGLENETNFVVLNINEWNKVSLTTTNSSVIVNEDF